MINKENWSHSQYLNGNLIAFVSMGADENAQIEYNVTVCDQDFVEKFQSTFPLLDEAIVTINSRHSNWFFKDLSLTTSSDGCDTCSAH